MPTSIQGDPNRLPGLVFWTNEDKSQVHFVEDAKSGKFMQRCKDPECTATYWASVGEYVHPGMFTCRHAFAAFLGALPGQGPGPHGPHAFYEARQVLRIGPPEPWPAANILVPGSDLILMPARNSVHFSVVLDMGGSFRPTTLSFFLMSKEASALTHAAHELEVLARELRMLADKR